MTDFIATYGILAIILIVTTWLFLYYTALETTRTRKKLEETNELIKELIEKQKG